MRFKKDRRTDAPNPPRPSQEQAQTVECGRCRQSFPLGDAVFVIWPDGDDMCACVRCVIVVTTFHEDAVITGPIGAEGID